MHVTSRTIDADFIPKRSLARLFSVFNFAPHFHVARHPQTFPSIPTAAAKLLIPNRTSPKSSHAVTHRSRSLDPQTHCSLARGFSTSFFMSLLELGIGRSQDCLPTTPTSFRSTRRFSVFDFAPHFCVASHAIFETP
jgi:hypothetical protein